jgi:hypothetical protein
MTTKIQSTTIKADRIEVVIADTPLEEEATVWVRLVLAANSERKMPVAAAQLIALQLARDAIASEMQEIASLASDNPGRFG